MLKPVVMNSKNELSPNSTVVVSYSKTSNNLLAVSQTETKGGRPQIKTHNIVKNSTKSQTNDRITTALNKSLNDLSKIESLRQTDFLPEIVTRDDLKKSLLEFEKKYDMSSEEFYSNYKQGKAIDNFDSLKWATLYEIWMQKYLMQV